MTTHPTDPAQADKADRRFTRDEVSQAVSDGADTVVEELPLGERDRDLVNLVVNAIMTTLDIPGIDLDGVIVENYDETPKSVRQWWFSWS